MSNESPLITTIIPTYRRPERLKRAIQSVLDQTYSQFQVCIYDNASGDSTAEVVSAFAHDPRVKYHCHTKNIGSVANFQCGLSQITTPFFSFLADDDYLLSEFYEETLRGFEQFPEAMISAGAVIDVDEKGKVIDIILSRWPEQERFFPPDGLLEMIGKYSNWTGMLFKREVIETIGLLDTSIEAIDVDFVFRAAAHVPLKISKKPVAVFVQHATPYSGENGLKLISPGRPNMIAKMKNDKKLPLPIVGQIEQLLLKDFRNLLVMNAVRSIARKKFEDAHHILNLLKQQPQGRSIVFPLAIVTHVCKALPFIQWLFVQLLHFRRALRRIKCHR